MRFNLHEHKIECDLEDVFDYSTPEVTIPKEWLDQVDTKAYQGNKNWKQGGWNKGMKRYFGGTYMDPGNIGTGVHNAKWTAQTPAPSEVTEPSFWDNVSSGVKSFAEATEEAVHNQTFAEWEAMQNSAGNMPSHVYDEKTGMFRRNQSLKDARNQELSELITAQERDLDETAEAYFNSQRGHGDMSDWGDYPFADPVGANSPSADGNLEDHSPDFFFYKQKYGIDCAEAWEDIDATISLMDGCDEGLMDIISQAHALMSKEGQTKLETYGFNG